MQVIRIPVDIHEFVTVYFSGSAKVFEKIYIFRNFISFLDIFMDCNTDLGVQLLF